MIKQLAASSLGLYFFSITIIRFFPAEENKNVMKKAEAQYQRIIKKLPYHNRKRLSLAVKKFEEQAFPSRKKRLHLYTLAHKLGRIYLAAGLAGMDVSEAALLVLNMATKDMDDDIRMIMAEIKSMTAAKQKLRELIQDLNNWISQEMGKAQDDIENREVETDSDRPVKVQKVTPNAIKKKQLQTGVTTHYQIKFPKAPIIKPVINIEKMTLSELKQEKQIRRRQLKGFGRINQKLNLKLQVLMDRRTKLIHTLLIIMKKMSDTCNDLIQNLK